MYYSNLVRKAALISYEAHKEDYDKGGYPYFMHPLHLAEQFNDEDSVVVSLLHDVIEDHGDKYSLKYLSSLGFNDDIINALDLLTHKENIGYLEYIINVSKSLLATKVKLEDLKHNLISERIDNRKNNKASLYKEAIIILENNLRK